MFSTGCRLEASSSQPKSKPHALRSTLHHLSNMKPSLLQLFLCCGLMASFCGGCATAPTFHPVLEVPPHRGLVYVFAPHDVTMGSPIWHNGAKLGGLGPDQ